MDISGCYIKPGQRKSVNNATVSVHIFTPLETFRILKTLFVKAEFSLQSVIFLGEWLSLLLYVFHCSLRLYLLSLEGGNKFSTWATVAPAIRSSVGRECPWILHKPSRPEAPRRQYTHMSRSFLKCLVNKIWENDSVLWLYLKLKNNMKKYRLFRLFKMQKRTFCLLLALKFDLVVLPKERDKPIWGWNVSFPCFSDPWEFCSHSYLNLVLCIHPPGFLLQSL